MKNTVKQKTRAELTQRIVDLEAQELYRLKRALKEIDDAGDKLFASAAVLSINGLGGRPIVEPVAILNGLSPETITAIKADLRRSFDLAILK